MASKRASSENNQTLFNPLSPPHDPHHTSDDLKLSTMGVFDSLLTSFLPFGTPVDAEAPKDDDDKSASSTDDGSTEDEVTEGKKADETEGEEGKEGEEGGEEEEEEEEEHEDIKPVLEEECANSKGCAPHKHHFDSCVSRVEEQIEKHGKANEDCVEEFFELAHCATSCAAPKLWKHLK